MILKDWLLENSAKLGSNELLYLAKGVLGIDCNDLVLELKECSWICLNLALKRRENGEPLSKIIGLKPFWNDYFITNEYTLDPRPETEILIEKIVGKPRSVLELGVGTGCLILSILKEFPKAKGVGVDISSEALDVAKENAEILGLSNKISFIRNDWAHGISGKYDLVISNPPYVSKGYSLSKETLHDPEIALFGSVETYAKLLDSLNLVEFRQLLLEVPEYWVKDVERLIFDKFNKKVSFDRIYNTNVFCLSLIIE